MEGKMDLQGVFQGGPNNEEEKAVGEMMMEDTMEYDQQEGQSELNVSKFMSNEYSQVYGGKGQIKE